MVSGITRKVVVIKDIPSNIIEEAILILKTEPGEKGSAGVMRKDVQRDGKDGADDHLIKEAQMIINNYVKENNLCVIHNRRLGGRRKLFGGKLAAGLLINLALLGSIAFLIFLFTKAF